MTIEAREDYLSWDDYFMGVALLSAMRSKDPSTQVGACIVNAKKRIVGTGYNGWVNGVENDAFPWSREGKSLDTKYPYVCHAEINAILNSRQNLEGCTLYVALFPCSDCAKAIVQSGIIEVVYVSDKHAKLDSFIAGRKILETAGTKLRELKIKKSLIKLDFEQI
jgi:dCMP deaminase